MESIKTFVHLDPVMDFSSPSYIVERGCVDQTYYAVTTSSFSNSNITITVNPPMSSTIIDRYMLLRVPFHLTFTGPAGSGNLLDIGALDALRAFPLSSLIQNLKINFDNSSVNIQMSDIIYATQRFIRDDTKNKDLSYVCTRSDGYQQYGDYLYYGFAKNALGRSGESVYNNNRSNNNNLVVVSNTPTSAEIYVELCEPFFVSPLIWKNSNRQKGLILTNQLQFYVGFGELTRIWSHGNITGGNTITSLNVNVEGNAYFDNAAVLLRIIESPADIPMSPVEYYQYYDTNVYKTTAPSLLAYSSGTVTSNNIQLHQTPKRMYIYLARQYSDRTYNTTDTFARIDSISINWNTRNGVLADANTYQLYLISAKNGLQYSFNDWMGYCGQRDTSVAKVYPSARTCDSGIGSVLCLDFGSDIPLAMTDAPGKLGQNQLTVKVNYTNLTNEQINYELDIIIINDGLMLKTAGNSQFLTGILSAETIMNSPKLPMMGNEIYELNNVYGGGDLFSGIQDVLKRAYSFGKRAYDFGKEAYPYVEPIVKEAIRQSPKLLPLLGLGLEEGGGAMGGAPMGGAIIGGKVMSRKKMKNRLRNY